MDQSVWASRGPEGETIGAVVQPLPTSHLIFRAPTNAAGKCWMDALELALRCSSLLSSRKPNRNSSYIDDTGEVKHLEDEDDVEKHFKADLEDTASLTSQDDGGGGGVTEQSGYHSEEEDEEEISDDLSPDPDSPSALQAQPPQTNYVEDPPEIFGTVSSFFHSSNHVTLCKIWISHFFDLKYLKSSQTENQTEEFSEENKSIVWFLMKQVRPGMDLSKVVLPTFILEPRSFLDKISDYYYHADIISRVSLVLIIYAPTDNETCFNIKEVE